MKRRNFYTKHNAQCCSKGKKRVYSISYDIQKGRNTRVTQIGRRCGDCQRSLFLISFNKAHWMQPVAAFVTHHWLSVELINSAITLCLFIFSACFLGFKIWLNDNSLNEFSKIMFKVNPKCYFYLSTFTANYLIWPFSHRSGFTCWRFYLLALG